MKITYPECQIEISVDEVIELNNYYEENKPVITCSPTELQGLKPVDSKHFGLTEESKKWLEDTLKDSLGKLHKRLLDDTDPNRHGEGIVHLIHEEPEPKPYPKEEETAPESQDPELEPEEDPTPTFEPGGIIGEGESEPEGEKVIRMSKEMKKAIVEKTPYVGRKKPSGKAKKVDVLFETGWKTFGSLTAAAKAIDARLNHLSHALMTGKTCNGHHVRYSNPELDAALAEIEEGKKKPYQPTPPVR